VFAASSKNINNNTHPADNTNHPPFSSADSANMIVCEDSEMNSSGYI
jgi:hypothetical protein